MNNSFYLPILKSKKGEFDALFHLDNSTRRHIRPLFEINPIEYDNQTKKKPKTLQEHLDNFCEKILKRWGSNPCFIDSSRLKSDENSNYSCLEYIYLHFSQGFFPFYPIPVLKLDSNESDTVALTKILKLYPINELAMRIDVANLGISAEYLKTLVESFDLKTTDVHIILDLADSDFTYVEDFADSLIEILEEFPFFSAWKSITLCGGAFPQTGILQKGINYIPRNDWKLYLLVHNKIFDKQKISVNFGDYGIVAPGYFAFDPQKMSRSANIRYTLDDIWFVLKGSALKDKEGFQQYVTQAMEITNESFYFGENFSYGDGYLKKTCSGNKTGNPTIWNGVGNNHHFTKVVADLFANPRAFLNS